MDNSPIFLNAQKRIKMSWGKAELIAGFIAAASIILFILIITYSAGTNNENISFSIIALRVLGGIAMFSSLIGIVLSIVEIKQNTVKAIGGATLNIFLLILASLVRSAYVPILPDERGIVISAFQPKGYRSEPLKPGLHWILPLVESTNIYSVAPQTYIMLSSQNQGDDSIQVITKDGQNLTISVSVTYSIDPAKVVELHINWQNRYEEEVVRPLVRGIVRDIASEYTAVEIMGLARRDMEQNIIEHLDPKFSENDLILIHFEITDVLQVK